MVKKLQSVEKKILETQKKLSENINKDKTSKKYKPVKEQYEEIKESMKPKVKEIDSEQQLIEELFQITESINNELETNESKSTVKSRDCLWDYVIEDNVDFFDPECSYELTGYKPITETKGLDFNPEWFTEAAMLYEATGKYTEYPQGTKPYNDYWSEQYTRCKEGYTVNGYRITGDHYFFLNFYRMQTIVEGRVAGKGRDEKFPSFFSKQYEFFHYVEMAEKLHKDVALLKARGLGMSEVVASLLVRPYTTNRGYKGLLTAPDEAKLKNTRKKCWKQLNWLDMNTGGGMRHLRQKVNNDDTKRATKVNKEGVEFGWGSEIDTVIADSSDKIRGDRLDRIIFEECFDPNTEIIMADSSLRKISDVMVGDFVLGIDGKPKEVIKTCSGEDDMYLIHQWQGIDYIVNSKHILYLDRRTKGLADSRLMLITPTEYLNLCKTHKKTTFGISTTGINGLNNFELDPYYFGLWLGDGYSKSPNRIIINNHDVEIRDYVINYFSSFNTGEVRSVKDSTDGCLIYYLHDDKWKNPLINQYKKFGLLFNKSIPIQVFQSSLDYKLKVLAGLIDTDGYISGNPSLGGASYQIAMSRKDLILQIKRLAESCGFKCHYHYRKRKNSWLRLNRSNHVEFTHEYRVTIKGELTRIPVQLARKKVNFSRVTTVNSTRIDVTPIGKGLYYGITLKSYGLESDNLFFLSDYTIVHNCGSNKILTDSWIKSNALVELGGEHFGSRICLGTGGDDMALEGLSKIFSNPEAYNVLPYKNYDTEDGETAITAFFIPAHKFSLKKDFLDSRGVTDSKRFREFYEQERKKMSGQDLLNYCAEHCFHSQEALLKQGNSIFDTIAIADRLTQLRVQKIGVKPQVVDLQWDCPNADINPRNKVKMIPNQFGKVKIFEPPIRDDDGNPYKNLYIAGIDSIDQGTGDSSTQSDVSDFCIVIKKRVHGSSMPNYVAIYKDRPKDIVTAYENAMKLLIMYNCKAMLEHTKISIIMHFRSKKMDKLLMQRPKSTLSDIRKGNSTMIGYPATETYLKHGLDLINTFVNESCYSIQIDEMLEQLLKYSWENKRKFDIIAAMIAAELGDEDLMGFTPKVSNAIANEWRDFGWYVDTYGNKRYGIIPK